nr:CPBP family intramembrane glutamic endopeptidase [Mobilicoccus pelagius]
MSAASGSPVGPAQAVGLVALTAVAGLLVTCVLALGEEIGWRGWLWPALRPLGRLRAAAAGGVIWAMWHLPIVLIGHNYTGAPRHPRQDALQGTRQARLPRTRTSVEHHDVGGHGAIFACSALPSAVARKGVVLTRCSVPRRDGRRGHACLRSARPRPRRCCDRVNGITPAERGAVHVGTCHSRRRRPTRSGVCSRSVSRRRVARAPRRGRR